MAGRLNSLKLGKGHKLSNPFKRHPRWPNAEASAGDLVAAMTKETCWEAIGPASEQYKALNEEINEHLEQCGDPALARVAFSLYMIGPTKTTSYPTIVFYSSNKASRDMVRSSVKRSGKLEKYPGFRTMAANQPLGIGKPLPAVMGSRIEAGSPNSKSEVRFILRARSGRLAGAELELCDQSRPNLSAPKATIGGILEWRGKLFVTTAAHIFDNSIGHYFSDLGSSEDLDYDIDEVEYDNCEADGDLSTVEMTSQGSATSGSSNSTASMRSSTSSDDQEIEENWAPMEDDPHYKKLVGPKPIIEGTGPWASSADALEPLLDIALFELPGLELQDLLVDTSGVISNEIGEINEHLGSFEICVLTRRPIPVKGRLSGSPTSVLSSTNGTMQELWTIQCEESLMIGDSGSLIVGAHGGKVYGHLVAISSTSTFAYIVPFKRVMNTLKEVFGGCWNIMMDVRLPSHPHATDEHGERRLISEGTIRRQFNNPPGPVSWPTDNGNQILVSSENQHDPLKDFRTFIDSADTWAIGCRGMADDTTANYVSLFKLQNYFSDTRLEEILTALSLNQYAGQLPHPSLIRNKFLRTFAILLKIGRGCEISSFVLHEDTLADQYLPHNGMPECLGSIVDNSWFRLFLIEQWAFCPANFKMLQYKTFEKDRVLPIVKGAVLCENAHSVTRKVCIEPEHNDFFTGTLSSDRPKTALFVIKTYKSGCGKELFEAERQAYENLLPIPDNVIKFYGGFLHNCHLNTIIENFGGTLQDFLETNNPPRRRDDVLTFWGGFLGIVKGLASIHTIEHRSTDEMKEIYGWHMDINPSNILYTRGNDRTGFDSSWKISDFTMCSLESTTEIKPGIPKHATHNTQTYGAPESDASNRASRAEHRQSADIWSLGCILSETAVWVSHGYDRVKEYTDQRRGEHEDPLKARGCDCFHDGKDVLETVKWYHMDILNEASVEGTVTPQIVRRLIMEMLVDDSHRPHSTLLWLRSQSIIEKAMQGSSSSKTLLGYFETDVPASSKSDVKSENHRRSLKALDRGKAQQSTDIFSINRPFDLTNVHEKSLASGKPVRSQALQLHAPSYEPFGAKDIMEGLSSIPEDVSLDNSAVSSSYRVFETTTSLLSKQKTLRMKKPWLAVLQGRDHVFLVDNNKSMLPHVEQLKEVLKSLTDLISWSEPNSLELHFTTSNEKQTFQTTTEIFQAIDRMQCDGLSEMEYYLPDFLLEYHESLNKHHRFRSLFSKGQPSKGPRKLTIYVLTDSLFQDEWRWLNTTYNLLSAMKRRGITGDRFGIQLIQFGSDAKAQELLIKRCKTSLRRAAFGCGFADITKWNGDPFRMVFGPG